MSASASQIVISGVNKVFKSSDREVVALKDINLTIPDGQFVCLLGPSGCGKSTLLNAIAGFALPSTGSIVTNGKTVTEPGPDRGMVFQEYALFPWMTVEENVAFGLEIKGVSKAAIQERVSQLLEKLGLIDFRTRFPKDLSGGMRQRVAIAIAMLHKPDLIIADEPTTALDVTIQAQILSEVQKLARLHGTALIWITHDLSVVAGLADEIAVMYSGRIVEQGKVADVLDQPQHPYTQGLIGSLPGNNRRGERLRQIPGLTPNLLHLPPTCAFAARCERVSEACLTRPEITEALEAHFVRCFHPAVTLVTPTTAEVRHG